MGNLLTEIDAAIFRGLKSLSMLSLQNNRIENIHKNAFDDLTQLAYL